MKLLFPNGEHEPVNLDDGVIVVGSGSDCQLLLTAPGIAVRHCQLRSENGITEVKPLDAQAVTVLNGRQISAESAIKPGDLLLFARVGCRVVAAEKAPTPPQPAAADGDSDEGRTRVRMALPKFLLRGVSGPTFGKTFGVTGALTLGRSSDCDISISSDEISRHHARLQLSPSGVTVEDLGSANGTFVNNQRVNGKLALKPGDELRLDTVRFLLMSPGMETHHPPAAQRPPAAASAAAAQPRSGRTIGLLVGIIVIALVVLGVLHYLGKF